MEEGTFLVLLSPEVTSFPESLLRLIWPCAGPNLLMFNPLDRDSTSEVARGRRYQRTGTAAHARSPSRTGGTCITRWRQRHPAPTLLP